MSDPIQTNMSLSQARHIVKDLFAPSAAIYWADFLVSLVAGSVCFSLARRVFPLFSPAQVVAFAVCILCYYRCVMFTHELVHLRDKSFRGFRLVWNLLCGIPFLIPSFMYYTHVEHHMRRHFGTDEDGEYLQLGSSSPWHILTYLCQPLWLPIVGVIRFLVLSPLTWISPRFRDLVHRRASSLIMDPTYIRPLPTRKVLRIMRLQEFLCFLWTLSVAVLLVTRKLPFGFLPSAYLVSVGILYLNHFRTLGAHRFINDGRELSFMEQLLDSVNYPARWSLAPIWAPVGLRYHALHHLFPSLPYHNLGCAHRKLMAELPADSPYRLTNSPGLPASIARLLRVSRMHDENARQTWPTTERQTTPRRQRASA